MTVARSLAEFLTQVSYADLPPQTVDHAAMLIASTIASAALGSGIASATIIRALARERGGTPEASIWFDPGPKLPVADAAQVNAVMSDAAASDDSDLRNIVHAGTTLVATSLAMAERTGASGQEVLAAIVLGYEAAGRIGEAITPGFRTQGFHGCLVAIFGGAVATGAAAGARRGAHGAGHRPVRDLDGRADGGGEHQCGPRVSRRPGGHAGGATPHSRRRRDIWRKRVSSKRARGSLRSTAATDGASVTRDLGHEWDIITDMAIKLVPGGHPQPRTRRGRCQRGQSWQYCSG